MTPQNIVDYMISLVSKDRSVKVLEPSCGQGVFVRSLKNAGFTNIDAYEVDASLLTLENKFINQSFVTSDLTKYDLVIGNPPYIRWKNLDQKFKDELQANPLWAKYCNSLCDYSSIFIVKAVEQLSDQGELIFITPAYWLNTTHSQKMRDFMLDSGYLEQLIYLDESPVFEDAMLALVIFKFVKSQKKLDSTVIKKLTSSIDSQSSVTDACFTKSTILAFSKGKSWMPVERDIQARLDQFEDACRDQSGYLVRIGDICEIANGMVSGLDRAFNLEDTIPNLYEKQFVIDVAKAKSLTKYYATSYSKYFLINESIASETLFKELCPNFASHLAPYQDDLKKRYQYNRQIPYWEWAFLRSYKLFNTPVPKIGVPCKERISHKNYFRFAYLPEHVVTTQDVTALFLKKDATESLYYLLAFLNHPMVFEWLKYNGIVKGDIVEFSERPLSLIPFKRINFQDAFEKKVHDQICELVGDLISSKNEVLIAKIEELISALL